ncbi:MAG: SMC-Scp complex subunit ScpB [Nanoarchaeota archaeon]
MVITSKTVDEIDSEKEKQNIRKIEAVLFISGKFLNVQELVMYSDLNPIIIKEVLDKLQEKYDNENSAIEIIEKNGLWKMDVKKEFEGVINKLATGSSEFSRSEQETLAIIAYKQPMKQSVLIKIRSNKAYEHIKKFFDLGLIRKKRLGHTWELSLSDDFYDYFNVSEGEGVMRKLNSETSNA